MDKQKVKRNTRHIQQITEAENTGRRIPLRIQLFFSHHLFSFLPITLLAKFAKRYPSRRHRGPPQRGRGSKSWETIKCLRVHQLFQRSSLCFLLIHSAHRKENRIRRRCSFSFSFFPRKSLHHPSFYVTPSKNNQSRRQGLTLYLLCMIIIHSGVYS